MSYRDENRNIRRKCSRENFDEETRLATKIGTISKRPRKSFVDIVVGVSTFRRRVFDKMSFFRSVSPPSSSSSSSQQQQQQQRRKNCCQTNAAATNSICCSTTTFPTTTTRSCINLSFNQNNFWDEKPFSPQRKSRKSLDKEPSCSYR